MFRLDADRPVEFCDGLRRRDFLHAGALATLGLSLTDWFGLRALGATANNDVNCILLMLIGGPSQLDTFDMKPNAPGRDPRAVQADQDQRARNRDLRELPAHGEARRQVLAHPQRVSHRRRGPRHRPSDDADRPPVSGRHRASALRLRALQAQRPEGRRPAARAAAAAHRQHRRQHAARPERRLPRQGATTRSCSTPTRPTRTSKCRTCCRRIT